MNVLTLTWVNTLLLLLYAGVIAALVQSDLAAMPGAKGEESKSSKGSMWFAWSNLLRGLGLLGLNLAIYPASTGVMLGAHLLVLIGFALLHRSFAEVLHLHKLWWKTVVGVTVVAAVALVVTATTDYVQFLTAVSVSFAVLLAITAVMLFRCGDRKIRAAAWFAGTMLGLYAALHGFRAVSLLMSSGHDETGPTQGVASGRAAGQCGNGVQFCAADYVAATGGADEHGAPG